LVRCLSRGGLEGHYRYHTDRVPLHTSLKSRQFVGHAFTHCHVSNGSRPRLPAEVGSSAATCPMALELTSQLRWALTLPLVIWLWISHLGWGGLQCCDVSYGSGPRLLAEVGPGAATCHMAPDLASRVRWAPALSRIPWVPMGP
jgi:hypothetical protein